MASSGRKYEYRVPRSFRLRQELEFAEKGLSMESKNNSSYSSSSSAASRAPAPKDPHAGFVSFGLGDIDESLGYDWQLCNWNGTIIGPQNTNLGERIYNLKIKCGPSYPDLPPTIHFVQKINMPGVDPNTGECNVHTFVKQWNRSNTMYDYLVGIRQQMIPAAKLRQPPSNETYP